MGSVANEIPDTRDAFDGVPDEGWAGLRGDRRLI